MDVGEDPIAFVGFAIKGCAQRMAHDTVCAIAANQPIGGHVI